MKKILTLLIAAGALVTVHAQSREENRRIILGERRDNGGNRDDRDVVLDRGRTTDRYPGSSNGDRQYQIDQINQDYDNKIHSIRNNPHLTNAEKERTIRQLENDRQRRIDEINRNNRGYDNRDRDDDRYDRRDNGKHKGWYKKGKNKNWKKGQRDRDRDWD